jgi:hypothetical protein
LSRLSLIKHFLKERPGDCRKYLQAIFRKLPNTDTSPLKIIKLLPGMVAAFTMPQQKRFVDGS